MEFKRFYIPPAHELGSIVPGKLWRVHDRDLEGFLGYPAVACRTDPDWWKPVRDQLNRYWPDMLEEGAYFATREEALAFMGPDGEEMPSKGLKKRDRSGDPKKDHGARVTLQRQLRAEGKKWCPNCEEIKPLTNEFWPKRNVAGVIDGFGSECKPCHNERNRRRKLAKKESP